MMPNKDLGDALLGNFDTESVQPAELTVRNVSYFIPASKNKPSRTLLSNVTCAFPPGKPSAIMGASGSGKTSLLTLLRGLSSAKTEMTGSIRCNGRRVNTEMMRSVACVVPQEDVFLAALTVRETLLYVAELRLPSTLTTAARRKRVEALIANLKLETCADTKVGDEKMGLRGISGGEKKRLSVGVALIGGLPQALLCDEPTSGLDSAAAEAMVQWLSSLARRGVTVVCSIHQPSYTIFQEFAHVLFLQQGETCYCGPVDEVEAFFKKHKAPTPAYTNPAHHYVHSIQQSGSIDWPAAWRSEQGNDNSMDEAPEPPRSTSGFGKSRLSLLQQTKVLTRRNMAENFKNKKKFFRGIMSRLPAAITIGIFFWRVAAVPTQKSIFPLQGLLFIAVQNPLIETFYAGATTFQLTRGVMKREYYDGLYHVAPYYVAYYCGFLAMQIPWTLVWVAPIYFLVGLPAEIAKFSVFLFAVFLVILMSCAAGSAVGTFTKDAEGNRAVLGPMMILMVLFSGYVIPFDQVPVVWRPIYYLSPVQWGMSILTVNHYQGLKFVDCMHGRTAGCFETGDDYLRASTNPLAQDLGVPGMLLLCCGYVLVFLLLNVRLIYRCVLDGRV